MGDMHPTPLRKLMRNPRLFFAMIWSSPLLYRLGPAHAFQKEIWWWFFQEELSRTWCFGCSLLALRAGAAQADCFPPMLSKPLMTLPPRPCRGSNQLRACSIGFDFTLNLISVALVSLFPPPNLPHGQCLAHFPETFPCSV